MLARVWRGLRRLLVLLAPLALLAAVNPLGAALLFLLGFGYPAYQAAVLADEFYVEHVDPGEPRPTPLWGVAYTAVLALQLLALAWLLGGAEARRSLALRALLAAGTIYIPMLALAFLLAAALGACLGGPGC